MGGWLMDDVSAARISAIQDGSGTQTPGQESCRRIEGRWADSDVLDHELGTLHENSHSNECQQLTDVATVVCRGSIGL
jgi:hypothetical protein